jgi:hypothetical protein
MISRFGFLSEGRSVRAVKNSRSPKKSDQGRLVLFLGLAFLECGNDFPLWLSA